MEELIEKSLETKQLDNLSVLIPHWKIRYRVELEKLRLSVKQRFNPVTANNIEDVQTVLTTGYRNLLKMMLAESFRLIDEPPCHYAWVGLGSFSRQEVLPYSDVEYLWLFEGNALEVRRYFLALDKLIIAQINSLEEPGGLHPDQYPEVSEVPDSTEPLPHGLEAIAQGVAIKCKAPQGVYTQIISLLQGKLIAGDESLWIQYFNQLKEISLSGVFRKILFVSVEDYEKTWGKDKGSDDRSDAKKGYGFFLTYLAVMLKFYYGVEGTRTQDIWTSLIQAGKIGEDLGKSLALASQEIQALRYRTHCFYQDGRQDFSSSNPPGLTNEAVYRLGSVEDMTLTQIKTLIDTVYGHLKAVKYLEQVSKIVKEGSVIKAKDSPVLPQRSPLSTVAFQVTLESVIQAYEKVQLPLLPLIISPLFLQSTLKKLLDDPQRLSEQRATQNVFDFMLKSGAKGYIENSLGLTPMRMVMHWSESYPVLAEKTWKALMQAEGDIEEQNSQYNGTLLEQSITENKLNSFMILCALGAGRKASVDKVLAYIQGQLPSRSTIVARRKQLKACLPQLMQQNATLAWRLALYNVRKEKAKSNITIAIEGTQTPAGYSAPLCQTIFFK